jgi:predicted benzoate:H+ symporter BenE
MPLLLAVTGLVSGLWTFLGGLIIGMAGTVFNLWLFRSSRNEFTKYVLAALVAMVGLLVYILFALAIVYILNR